MFTYLVVGFTLEITNVLLFVANHESSKVKFQNVYLHKNKAQPCTCISSDISTFNGPVTNVTIARSTRTDASDALDASPSESMHHAALFVLYSCHVVKPFISGEASLAIGHAMQIFRGS